MRRMLLLGLSEQLNWRIVCDKARHHISSLAFNNFQFLWTPEPRTLTQTNTAFQIISEYIEGKLDSNNTKTQLL